MSPTILETLKYRSKFPNPFVSQQNYCTLSRFEMTILNYWWKWQVNGDFESLCAIGNLDSACSHVEALALRAALELLHDQQWLEVEIEMDCSSLLSALESAGDELSDIRGKNYWGLRGIKVGISVLSFLLYLTRSISLLTG